jgi:hypothetical protein
MRPRSATTAIVFRPTQDRGERRAIGNAEAEADAEGNGKGSGLHDRSRRASGLTPGCDSMPARDLGDLGGRL